MRKAIALVLVLAFVFVLVGCDTGSGDGETKLGLGVYTKISSSYDLRENNDGDLVGRAQADTTVAGVMLDSEGKVLDVWIDTAQTAIFFNEDGEIISDTSAEYLTKRERGDDYGMIRASPIGREWYEQIEAIEAWMIGKTRDQIANMALEPFDDYGNRPAEVDLTSLATMRVDDYLKAVLEAIDNAR